MVFAEVDIIIAPALVRVFMIPVPYSRSRRVMCVAPSQGKMEAAHNYLRSAASYRGSAVVGHVCMYAMLPTRVCACNDQHGLQHSDNFECGEPHMIATSTCVCVIATGTCVYVI